MGMAPIAYYDSLEEARKGLEDEVKRFKDSLCIFKEDDGKFSINIE